MIRAAVVAGVGVYLGLVAVVLSAFAIRDRPVAPVRPPGRGPGR